MTTDGSDAHALVPKHGHGVHLEEVGELSKAGGSRNAHRVAVWRGSVGNGNYGRNVKRKENADAAQ
jgi:hypothetical protein